MENRPEIHSCTYECMVGKAKAEVEEIEQEVPVVHVPNTIINPWTMMIHFKYTFIADLAVVRSVRFEILAFKAKSITFFYKFFRDVLALTFKGT